jgi:hypothetical protein
VHAADDVRIGGTAGYHLATSVRQRACSKPA